MRTHAEIDKKAAYVVAEHFADMLAGCIMQSKKRCRTYDGQRKKVKDVIADFLCELIDEGGVFPTRQSIEMVKADPVFIRETGSGGFWSDDRIEAK